MRIYLIGFGVANLTQAAGLSTHTVPHEGRWRALVRSSQRRIAKFSSATRPGT